MTSSDVVTVPVGWAWIIGTCAVLGALILLLEILWTLEDWITRRIAARERTATLRTFYRLARKATTP